MSEFGSFVGQQLERLGQEVAPRVDMDPNGKMQRRRGRSYCLVRKSAGQVENVTGRQRVGLTIANELDRRVFSVERKIVRLIGDVPFFNSMKLENKHIMVVDMGRKALSALRGEVHVGTNPMMEREFQSTTEPCYWR